MSKKNKTVSWTISEIAKHCRDNTNKLLPSVGSAVGWSVVVLGMNREGLSVGKAVGASVFVSEEDDEDDDFLLLHPQSSLLLLLLLLLEEEDDSVSSSSSLLLLSFESFSVAGMSNSGADTTDCAFSAGVVLGDRRMGCWDLVALWSNTMYMEPKPSNATSDGRMYGKVADNFMLTLQLSVQTESDCCRMIDWWIARLVREGCNKSEEEVAAASNNGK